MGVLAKLFGLIPGYRLYLLLCLCVLATGTLLLVARLTGHRFVAAATAVTSSLAYTITFPVGVCAEFPHLIGYAMLPWLLMVCCETVSGAAASDPTAGPSPRRAVWCALLLGLIALSNPPLGYRCALTFALVLCVEAVVSPNLDRKATLRLGTFLAAVGVACLLLVVSRAWLALHTTHAIEANTPGWSLGSPPAFTDFLARRLRFAPFDRANVVELPYLGLFACVLLVWGVAAGIARRSWIPGERGLLAGALFWALAYRFPQVWHLVPLAGLDGAPFRSSYLAVQLATVCAGLAAARIARGNARLPRVMALLLVLGIGDLFHARWMVLKDLLDVEALPQRVAFREMGRTTACTTNVTGSSRCSSARLSRV
ncbi:MAG: hypothetical protein HY815_00500 [Candidatus Riflebacteria bacterium]|nr:hypothetical protein [Candidatus Riflebacteria bacterium]